MRPVIVHTFLKPFSQVFNNSACHFLWNGSDFLADCTFKLFDRLRAINVNVWFEVSPEEIVTWIQVWRAGGPADVAKQWDYMTREHLPQNLHRPLRSVGSCSILLKPNSVQIVEMCQFWSDKGLQHLTLSIRVHSDCNVVFFEEIRTPNAEFCNRTPYCHPRRMQWALMQFLRVVLGPISEVLFIYCITQAKMCFISKQHNSFGGDMLLNFQT